MRRRSNLRLACAAAAVALASGPVAAQLSDEVVTGPRPSQQAIEGFVAPLAQRLTSSDPAAVAAARTALLEPFRRPGAQPSVGFRLGFGNALNQTLSNLVEQAGPEIGAINALVVAGTAATTGMVEIIVEALDDERPGVRYAASSALRDVLEYADAAGQAGAVREEALNGALEAAAARLGPEPDIRVVDGLILTLVAATESTGVPSWNWRAAEAMCRGMSDQIARRRADAARAGVAEMSVLVRAVGEARDIFFIERAGAGGIDDEFARAAAVMAGQAVAYCMAIINDAGPASALAPDRLAWTVQLINAAQSLLLLADSEVNQGGAIASEPIRDAVERWQAGRTGALEQLRSEVEKWVGPGGVLTRPPYGLDASALR